MTKRHQQQLELPILSNVNGKHGLGVSSYKLMDAAAQPTSPIVDGFHKPASVVDQSIYKSISDSYFGAKSK